MTYKSGSVYLTNHGVPKVLMKAFYHFVGRICLMECALSYLLAGGLEVREVHGWDEELHDMRRSALLRSGDY